MGAVYGVINLLVGAWFYRTAHTVQKPAITWAVIGAAVFLGCLIGGYGLNYLIQVIIGADTTTMGPAQSATGADFSDYGTNFTAILYEFIPLIFGIVGAALVRSVFLLKTGAKDAFGFVKDIKMPNKNKTTTDTPTAPTTDTSDNTDKTE
ncbi:MAG: hypothetical protein V3V22_08110 [Methylococcales bacterium]